MNTFSKIHQEFSRRLNNPRVLTNPEEFLGPNFEAVLNFWLFLDDLSEDQLKNMIININYWDFCDAEWSKEIDKVYRASDETIGWKFAINAADAAEAAWYVYENSAALDFYSYVALYLTRELIAMHKIFEAQQPLTFFPMFLEVL